MAKMVCVASESRAEPVYQIERMRKLLAHECSYKLKSSYSLGCLDVDGLNLFLQLLHVDCWLENLQNIATYGVRKLVRSDKIHRFDNAFGLLHLFPLLKLLLPLWLDLFSLLLLFWLLMLWEPSFRNSKLEHELTLLNYLVGDLVNVLLKLLVVFLTYLSL